MSESPVLEPEYTLRWPRSLFRWEAERLLQLGDDSMVASAMGHLVSEACEEEDAQENFFRSLSYVRNVFDTATEISARPTTEQWLSDFLTQTSGDGERLAPEYWAQRHGYADLQRTDTATTVAENFSSLVTEMSYNGYFPRLLPKPCVDDRNWDASDAGPKISRAVQLKIDWPIPEIERASYPTEKLLTLVEYFHDQAYRPRLPGYVHVFGDCGPHYSDWNKDSGRAIYRWRVNELLELHGINLRLSKNTGERGRLVSVLPQPLEEIVEQQLEARQDDPNDEVAHAVRDYRSRSAGRAQKVAALALLAGQLERRRDLLKASLQKGDESSLFDIANNYAIRHRNDRQKQSYGEEYLDWVFHIYISTIQLLDDLNKRQPSDEST